ncbi:MAG: HAD-IA family hydrolase [Gammaproteobacteria bacterium]|nr:HAD-IA family hydrolase [Gammaproteobacteria bacterium]
MKNRFDLIVFDWDGTLINTIDWIVHCLQLAGVRHGCKKPEPQAAKDVIGLCIDNAVAALYPEVDTETKKRIVSLYSQTYSSKQLSRADFFPGVYDMLLNLKEQGYRLAVATGKTRAGLIAAMKATGTEDLFDSTRCADETASKPNPLMLHEIMAQTQSAKDRTLMVGDSIHDMQMAQNAQIASIGVSCGANSMESLQRYNPLFCLQQPAELLNLMA